MAMFGPGKTVGVVMGAFLCLGLLFVAIAATIVLSLISIYTPNNSVQQYGEEYRINALMLKSLSSSSTAYNFSNSTMADNTQLSTACSTTYTNAGEKNVAGCVVDNNVAYLATNTSTNSKRRRRQTAQFGLYTVSRARLFYSTPCSKIADKGKYANSSGLSSCVSNRLAACNKLFNNTGSDFVTWTLSSSMTYSVVDTTFSSYITMTIFKVFGIRPSSALALAKSLSMSASTQSNIQAGCQYIGPLSQSAIAAAIAAQSTVTTTAPSSTQAVG